MHISYFSFVALAFIFLLLAGVFISANSVWWARLSSLYKKPWHYIASSSLSINLIVIKSIVSFHDGLSSEYVVVKNQRTPLVIVQFISISWLVVRSSMPVVHIFITNVVLVASIAPNFEFNLRLQLCWIEALTPIVIKCIIRFVGD